MKFKKQMVFITISCIIFYILFIGTCLYLLINVGRLSINFLPIFYVEFMSKILIGCSILGIIYTVNNYKEALLWS